jgi:hypothetical protein
MLTQETRLGYDPKKLISLKAVSGLFIKGERIEPGQVFEVEAQEVGNILSTGRAKFKDEADRPLVFKSVTMF